MYEAGTMNSFCTNATKTGNVNDSNTVGLFSVGVEPTCYGADLEINVIFSSKHGLERCCLVSSLRILNSSPCSFFTRRWFCRKG